MSETPDTTPPQNINPDTAEAVQAETSAALDNADTTDTGDQAQG